MNVELHLLGFGFTVLLDGIQVLAFGESQGIEFSCNDAESWTLTSRDS